MKRVKEQKDSEIAIAKCKEGKKICAPNRKEHLLSSQVQAMDKLGAATVVDPILADAIKLHSTLNQLKAEKGHFSTESISTAFYTDYVNIEKTSEDDTTDDSNEPDGIESVEIEGNNCIENEVNDKDRISSEETTANTSRDSLTSSIYITKLGGYVDKAHVYQEEIGEDDKDFEFLE
ncbi:hypothetical protein BCR33DRAFT_793202 [Rhizoclosmatium globosum]|uniref:Uncharacterized protein n=1 Tax=Rhizoclosmatium globosum TaxID=329046 RepID=A0A1Y2B337_9FUNG|nr:hypothetical protein BCR33DRAFT_793202 [Rhizoclosmatium globosum]|eukprot:ORY28907.1 hypothetical protein BCR33DRAFT_793202 [Rhizoclosmatium globosum]